MHHPGVNRPRSVLYIPVTAVVVVTVVAVAVVAGEVVAGEVVSAIVDVIKITAYMSWS